jgi:cell division protein FtsN
VNPEYKENIAEYDAGVGAGIDRREIKYRVQLGVFEGDIPTETLELFLSLGDVKPVKDADGKTRYLKGTYDSASEAEKVKNELSDQGIITPVVVGDYKGKLMSLEEVIELLND